MRTWEVNAELNMNASNRKTIIVKANTERKARIKAEEKFIKDGAHWVWDMRVKEIKESEVV